MRLRRSHRGSSGKKQRSVNMCTRLSLHALLTLVAPLCCAGCRGTLEEGLGRMTELEEGEIAAQPRPGDGATVAPFVLPMYPALVFAESAAVASTTDCSAIIQHLAPLSTRSIDIRARLVLDRCAFITSSSFRRPPRLHESIDVLETLPDASWHEEQWHRHLSAVHAALMRVNILEPADRVAWMAHAHPHSQQFAPLIIQFRSYNGSFPQRRAAARAVELALRHWSSYAITDLRNYVEPLQLRSCSSALPCSDRFRALDGTNQCHRGHCTYSHDLDAFRQLWRRRQQHVDAHTGIYAVVHLAACLPGSATAQGDRKRGRDLALSVSSAHRASSREWSPLPHPSRRQKHGEQRGSCIFNSSSIMQLEPSLAVFLHGAVDAQQHYSQAIDDYASLHAQRNRVTTSRDRFVATCNKLAPMLSLPHSLQLPDWTSFLPPKLPDLNWDSERVALQQLRQETIQRVSDVLLAAKSKHVVHLDKQCLNVDGFLDQRVSAYAAFIKCGQHPVAESLQHAAIGHFRDHVRAQCMFINEQSGLSLASLHSDRDARPAPAAAAAAPLREQTGAEATHADSRVQGLTTLLVEERLRNKELQASLTSTQLEVERLGGTVIRVKSELLDARDVLEGKQTELESESHRRQRAEEQEATHREALQDLRICVVCQDHPRQVLLLTCGHWQLCESCFDGICASGRRVCPSCSQPIYLNRVKRGFQLFA